MAINHVTDKAAILALSTEMKSKEMTDDEYADKMATIMENIALSLTITVTGTATGAVGGGPGVPITGTGEPS